MPSTDPDELTIDELEDEIEEVGDTEDLEQLLEAERAGKNRKGAKQAIEQRQEEVSEAGENDADRNGDETGSRESDESGDEDGVSGGDGRSAPQGADGAADGEASGTDIDAATGVVAVRKAVHTTAPEIIGHELDGITEISETDGGWRAVVEVVERRSIPDTQDILGCYELDVDDNGTVTSFRRLDRYKRGRTSEMQ